MAVERAFIRPTIGRPSFTMLLVTLGVLLIIEQSVRSIWTQPGLVLSTPWGTDRFEISGVTIRHADLWTVGIAAALLVGFFVFFHSSRLGLGMRLAAADQEAAAAQGVRVGRAFAVSWAIAAAIGVVAGVMLTSRAGSALSPGLGFIALRAFPAMIVGGLDSTGGAVAGGMIIGVTEVMSQGYVDEAWVGENFDVVVPYLLMLAILFWRPSGLFGTRTVVRV